MESEPIYTEEAGKVLHGLLEATVKYIPGEMVLDGLKGYVACWTIGIIDIADSIHILIRTGKVLAGRAVSRSLIEAYAKLLWSLDGSTDLTCEQRFLAIDQQWTTDYKGTFDHAVSAKIPLLPSAQRNVIEQQAHIARRMATLGITKLPKVPSISDITKIIQEPLMYWSYKAFSDAVHPSSGLVNDVFNLSLTHLTFNASKHPAKLAELMEIVIQVVIGTMKKVAPYLSFLASTYLQSISSVQTAATKLMGEMVAPFNK